MPEVKKGTILPAQTAKSRAQATAPARRRLSGRERREQIIEAAIRQFSESGFESGTKSVADRMGVTQPLIYRYFPAKDDLIKAVYERLFLGGFRPDWLALVTDRHVSLRQRLIDFYRNYTEVVFQPDWIRIYLFSSLKGYEIHHWWLTFVEDHILTTICGEIRQEFGLPSIRSVAVRPAELEQYWLFHGGIFYYGLRREVYGATPRVDLTDFLETGVDTLLNGYGETVRALVEARSGDIAAAQTVEQTGAPV